MTLIAKENLHAAPVDEARIFFRAFDQNFVKSLRRRSAGERDTESAVMLDRALSASNELICAGLGYVVKIVKNSELRFGHGDTLSGLSFRIRRGG